VYGRLAETIDETSHADDGFWIGRASHFQPIPVKNTAKKASSTITRKIA
jgi:hypothetical protein